ncbi:MAG: SH3 domain-containing protein [Eubacterium sp.]|nr:SH3 domain-containing protein [Eubacterium sp.]
MIKKLLVSVLCAALMAAFILSAYIGLYFLLPSRQAASSIDLPENVRDTAESTKQATEASTEETKENLYYADVHESLTLRERPDSGARAITSLPPYTHMIILEQVEGTKFAYVEVTEGDHIHEKGYVNMEYITPDGEEPRLAE